jgi:hypothetical protein
MVSRCTELDYSLYLPSPSTVTGLHDLDEFVQAQLLLAVCFFAPQLSYAYLLF